MASESDDVQSRSSDNSTERQQDSAGAERHERMLDETQQGQVAEDFGKDRAEQRTQDSKNFVNQGALPELSLEDNTNNQKGESSDSQTEGDASSGSDRSKKAAGKPELSGSSESQIGKKVGADNQQETQEAQGKAPLTPPEPVTFHGVQPSGYVPGAGGINGGRYDTKDRIAPTTADFFNKKNPSDYVAIAVDPNARVKDGQKFFSPELDQKYSNELAQKYPDAKPEDRHMWLRAVDSGGAFRNTWGANGPTRVDVAVANSNEGSKINEHGHKAKNPADAIRLTMVPESDRDRVEALAKMPTREKKEDVRGLDFGYRDEKKSPTRLFRR